MEHLREQDPNSMRFLFAAAAHPPTQGNPRVFPLEFSILVKIDPCHGKYDDDVKVVIKNNNGPRNES